MVRFRPPKASFLARRTAAIRRPAKSSVRFGEDAAYLTKETRDMISNGPTQVPTREAIPEGGSASRIVGEGEMADRVRGFDWSTTPLGPIETWPHELVTVVNLTLCAPIPARTLWGRDHILIYNDRYKRFPGSGIRKRWASRRAMYIANRGTWWDRFWRTPL